jgi:hypothetical protein
MRNYDHNHITTINDEGDEVTLPSRWAICDDCNGDGTHALHGIAITASEWAEWGEDDQDTYRRGGYDTTCETCGGTGKVREVDEDRCDPALLRSYQDGQRELAESYAISAMERAYGC